ncbi:TPA: hypothetical protein ACXDAY_001112 [Clostridium botulinum]|uniref:hypothetical protein n=2 Tax=Clostridium botulinum TaxID=1491 RepID=UPI00035BA5B0|nr:hypothetical protein [Clostridium botulinum]EPS55310.1 hypothetical protein CLQ_07318 [Clostridium botulinum Af84]MBN3349061.1 hypothetical protein [Clostridium botulinum]MBN3356629.1 hypothetical protein [Clostridium botulinum]NFM81047.1 hypothetical protein [Clostridium botulinum]NFP10893.1 hypothetical protein [Clostridium botulinum]
MEYLGIEKFGTLFINNIAQARSSRPWFPKNYPGNLSERGDGAIPQITSNDTVQIRSTQRGAEIQWIHIAENNKHIYISDQVLVTDISWNYLNERNMIFGTPVTIDGKEYKLRILTGGDLQNQNNEWDTIIRNTANITGLPKPTQEDLTNTNTYGQLDGDHNQLWNWWGIRTICQETLYSRGYTGASGSISINPPERSPALGWRPVLEYIDPPEKPEIIYPVGTNEKPAVVMDDPIIIKTEFNNPSGEFNTMPVRVMDITTDTQIKYAISSSLDYWITYPLILGHLYRVSLSHINTAKQESEVATTYFIYSQLNKYKLSESITLKQNDKIKSYTGGENLIMKPQTFPETENSVIRLVPQTMNTLTVRGIEGNELEYSESTKTPVIGDRLLVDDKVVTVTEAQGMQDQEEEIVRNIGGISSGSISLGITTSGKYVKRGDYIYTIKREDTTSSELRVVKISLADNTVENTYRRIVTGNTDFAIAEGDTGIFVAYNHTDTKKVNIYWKGYESGTAIKETSFALNITGLNCVYDSKAKLLHLIVNLDNPGANKKIISAVTYNASDPTNMTSIGQKNLLETDASTTICEPATIYTPDIFGVTVGIISNNQYANKIHLYGYDNGTWSSSIGTLNTKPNYKPFGIHLEYIPKDKDSARVARILATTSARDTINNLGDITVSIGIGGYNMKHSALGVPDPTENYGCLYSEDEGFILLYSRGKTLFMRQKKNVEDEWGRANSIIESLALNQRAIIPVNISPKAYCSFPSMAYINNEVPGEAASMKYKTTRLTGRIEKKVFLDKEVSVQAGEKIKYLDYDLEVKAGEETAKITPTNITDSYYEYDAQFDKKEAQRDITIKGRNTKLTTLYYYNY